jgi:hypothetical protein
MYDSFKIIRMTLGTYLVVPTVEIKHENRMGRHFIVLDKAAQLDITAKEYHGPEAMAANGSDEIVMVTCSLAISIDKNGITDIMNVSEKANKIIALKFQQQEELMESKSLNDKINNLKKTIQESLKEVERLQEELEAYKPGQMVELSNSKSFGWYVVGPYGGKTENGHTISNVEGIGCVFIREHKANGKND